MFSSLWTTNQTSHGAMSLASDPYSAPMTQSITSNNVTYGTLKPSLRKKNPGLFDFAFTGTKYQISLNRAIFKRKGPKCIVMWSTHDNVESTWRQIQSATVYTCRLRLRFRRQNRVVIGRQMLLRL